MQQPVVPQVALPLVVFSLCILALFGVSLSLWIRGLIRWSSGLPVLPQPEPRRMQRWGLVDLIFAFFVVFVLATLAAGTGFLLKIGPRPGPDGVLDLRMMVWISTVQSLALGIVTVFIVLRLGIKLGAVGWSLENFFRDLRLGIIAFIVIAPPMYVLMVIVTLLSGMEYSHPIQQMASKNPWLLIPATFMAVILAPLGEEFAFRVLIQGFLESMSKGRLTIEKLLLGRTVNDVSYGDDQLALNDRVTTVPDEAEPTETLLPWWPIFVSGILFGLLHFQYGMSWIPLILLGIALGWLYRVTNRIWPSLVVHVCVNATSMIGFALSVLFGDPSKL